MVPGYQAAASVGPQLVNRALVILQKRAGRQIEVVLLLGWIAAPGTHLSQAIGCQPGSQAFYFRGGLNFLDDRVVVFRGQTVDDLVSLQGRQSDT